VQPLLRGLDALVGRLLAAAGVQQELGKASDMLGQLAGGRTMLKLIGWSAGAWLIEGLAYLLVVKWLPSTRGDGGAFAYFTAQAMGVSSNQTISAATIAFLVHMVIWLPPTVAGGLYMLLSHPAVATTLGLR
jgi:hypothetical protein